MPRIASRFLRDLRHPIMKGMRLVERRGFLELVKETW